MSAPRTGWVVLALVGAVAAVYAQVLGFEFVRYDDPDYVLENPAVRGGLSLAGLRWAFSAAHASNWHPLTWLAHMLDVELFQLAPAGHHGVSVAWHALAAVLCFLALRALSARPWESAAVAALFALHPLRVESVAWVSERKDVLSGSAFFALLLAYARYARAPSAGRYALLLACFALGLLAKPMLVTAPCVLLLLDFWPLARLRAADGRLNAKVWLEKLPLLALAALSCAATVWSQRAGGSLYTLEVLPLDARLANAPVAVLRYLAHFVWPSELSYFYPHPALVAARATPWTLGALSALGGVLTLSALAWAVRRRSGAFFCGWFWFLGMLVPVIGIVQVGEQALADRYAYLPLVGVQLVLVFALGELARRQTRVRLPLGAGAALALVACGVASARQARVWHDSEALFTHALAVTEQNYPAWVGLANERAARGEVAGARTAYEEALAIRASYAPALYGLGLLEQEHGDAERALALYRRASEALPGLAAAQLNLGMLLAERGDEVEAAQAFERVLELFPEHPDAHYDLALLLLLHRQYEPAAEHLEAAVRANPGAAAAWEKLGEVREAQGEHRAALAALERALADPTRTNAARLAAWILASAAEDELRDPQRALELARRAVQATQRRDPPTLEALAAALAAGGDFERAVAVQEEALRLLPPNQQGAARERLELYRRDAPYHHAH
ncbi:MAG: tetratricopeptide repeat protein [Planctomycetes bacterium]|nr:tetratricopeptide repeat protein [Planctomycetota bacterium]